MNPHKHNKGKISKIAYSEQHGIKIDFLEDPRDFECVFLASLGFSNDLIQRKTKLSIGQINYRLKKANVKRSEYRSGKTKIAAIVLKNSREAATKYLSGRIRNLIPN